MEYIVLGPNKTPTEKISNGGHPLDEVKEFANVGVLIPEPMVVFDFDSASDSEIILKIVDALDLKCLVMKTTRGVHLWFKSPEIMKNSIKTRCAIGLYYDVRSWGKPCYTVVKKAGEWREWLREFPLDEISEVPAWLKPLSFSKYSFKGMGDGDGRNQNLYEYILVMQSKHYTVEQIKETIKIINEFVFADPLPESEIDTILRTESFKTEQELKESSSKSSYFSDDGSFKHNLFAEALIKEMNVVTVNEQLYIYADGYYQKSDRAIEQHMIEVFPGIRKVQRSEVMDYLKIITTVKADSIPRNEYIINLQNTRLDLKTGEILPFDAKIVEFCRIPIEYKPDAYCADLDKMLNKVFNADRQVIDLFEEMAGYCLIKNCRFRKGFLFYGGGSNGKSTILNVLKRFIGEENYATIEMEKLTDKFKTAELENRMVNIGDDINRRDILDTGTLKKLFTGESVMVERKGQTPFNLKSYAKMIFSCNEIPRIADKSNGMYSRLMLIPFTQTFTSLDADFDPFIEDKVTTDIALSYLLNIALRGLRRLLHNGDFTYPAVVKQALEMYKMDNSTVLTWIAEESIPKKYLLEHPTDKLFSDFKDWCNRSDIKFGASIRTFHKEIEDRFGFERVRSRNNDTDNQYRWKFLIKLD